MKKHFLFFSLLASFSGMYSQLQDTQLAEECFKKADYKCAETAFAALAEKEQIGKLKSKFYNSLGTSQRRQGKVALAFKSYENALVSDPENIQSYINLSSFHSQKGNREKGLDYAAKGLIIDSQNQEILLIRAKIYEDLKKYDLAEKDFQNAISSAPENMIPKTNYAAFKKSRGKFEEALKDYNQLLAEKPESLIYNNRADTYLAMKKYKEALADVEKAIKLDSKFSLTYVTKAKILFESGRHSEACNALDKALEYGFQKYMIRELLKKCKK